MVSRLAVSIGLLLVLGGVVWWSAAQGGSSAVVGDHWVGVVGPSGSVEANGTVHTLGTPLAAVQALGAQRNFTVDLEERPLVGTGCSAHYLVGIAGQRETTTGGWNYYTRAAAGQSWSWRSAGAACYALSPGEQVEWCWVESDVCRHHAP